MENNRKREVGVSKISHIDFIPLSNSSVYEEVDTSKVNWFKWMWMRPNFKVKKGCILYTDGWHWHTLEDILDDDFHKSYLCSADGKLKKKARVIINYLCGECTGIRFDSNEEAYKKYVELCNTFGCDITIKYEENYE